MPCPEKHLSKLDAMLDSVIKPKADGFEQTEEGQTDCDTNKEAMKDGDRDELRQGALSKEQ
jgi:hypothetical protein